MKKYLRKAFLLILIIISILLYDANFFDVIADERRDRVRDARQERNTIVIPTATPIPPTPTPTPTSLIPTPTPIMCGGIQGKVCGSGYQCIYTDGTTRAPSADASGKCLAIGAKVSSQTEIPLPVNGTEDFCQSMSISDTNLESGESLTMTLNAKTSDITTFGFAFYNKDNGTKAIKYTAGTTYSIGSNVSIANNTYTLTLDFADIDKKDTNWNNYMSKPKNIEVWGFFKHINGKYSKWDKVCSVSFAAATIDPTPTPNSTCVCTTAGTCATTCFYDKFATPVGFTYATAMKCNLGNDLFSSAPTSTDKNKWCQSYYRTKGDADADGKASLKDYFYLISVRSGAKVSSLINVDFDGDGYITNTSDRAIITKSLK